MILRAPVYSVAGAFSSIISNSCSHLTKYKGLSPLSRGRHRGCQKLRDLAGATVLLRVRVTNHPRSSSSLNPRFSITLSHSFSTVALITCWPENDLFFSGGLSSIPGLSPSDDSRNPIPICNNQNASRCCQMYPGETRP